MKRIQTLTLAGAGARQQVTRGNFSLDKGKLLKALRLKVTVPVKNTTGGTISGLTDAQKQTLFGLFRNWVSYGKDGAQRPFEAIDWARMHREARFAFGSEIEGYTDSTTGLGRTIANNATQNMTFYMLIPLGYLWFLPARDARLFGMGRSQVSTLQLEVQLDTLTIATNIVIDVPASNVTIEVYPQVESCKGDVWGAVPFYRQNDTSNDEIEGPEGLPLRISERSQVHASSQLTSVNVRIDDEVIHEAMSPQDTITEYNDLALATAAGSLVDRETILYAVGPSPGANLSDLPTGRPRVKQVVKNIATMQMSYLYLPTQDTEDVKSALEVASRFRGKELKAASQRFVRGGQAPARIDAVLGAIMLDRDDKEFEQAPGFARGPGETDARLLVPDSIAALAKSRVAQHKAAGENKQAADVAKQLAALVPGAIPGARGFSRGGSAVLNTVAASIGG